LRILTILSAKSAGAPRISRARCAYSRLSRTPNRLRGIISVDFSRIKLSRFQSNFLSWNWSKLPKLERRTWTKLTKLELRKFDPAKIKKRFLVFQHTCVDGLEFRI
jgi:hypothetical protein